MDYDEARIKTQTARRGDRLRGLAAPFVVTVSLGAGGCIVVNPPLGTDSSASEPVATTGGTDVDSSGTAGTTGTSGTSGTEGGTGTTAGGSTSQTEETVNPPVTTGTTDDATTSSSTSGSTTGDTSDTSDTGGSFDPDDDGVQLCGGDYPMDPVDITSGVINGDTLTLSVAYGGGCEEHDFGLCWDSLFLESEPVQVNLALAHDGMGDACEAYIMEDLVLDLTPLKQAYQDAYQTDTGTITIHVDGLDGPITYSF